MTGKATPAELAAILYEGSRSLTPGAMWRHRKTGDEYTVLAVALNEADLTPMVAYAPLDAQALGLSITWVRPSVDFRAKFERSMS